jgi:hypothetical protein
MDRGASVQTAEAARRCPDCRRPIAATRRYCDRDRDRRRVATFTRQAYDLAIDAELQDVSVLLGRALDALGARDA